MTRNTFRSMTLLTALLPAILPVILPVILPGCGGDEPGGAKDAGAASDAASGDATSGDVQHPPSFSDHAEIIFLDATDEDGELPAELHAGHPLRVTATLRPTKDFSGDLGDISLQFGLVEKHPDTTPNSDVHTCYLGEATQSTGTISKNGDGTYTYVMEQLIPESCVRGLSADQSRVFNLWAGINMPQEHDVRPGVWVAEGDYNTVFFNSQQVDLDGLGRAQKCKDKAGKAGCIIDLTIAPSPGPNVAVTRFELESTLMPLYLASCGTATRHEDPGLSFQLGLTLYGRDPHDGKTRAPATGNHLDDHLEPGEHVAIHAEICPVGESGDSCAKGTDFHRLHVTPRQKDKTTIETAKEVQVTEMRSGHEVIFGLDAHIDAKTDLCTRLIDPKAKDSWVGRTHFRLKVCADPPFEEKGHSVDDDHDHCRVDVVRLVRIDDSGGAASSLGFKKVWSKKIGNDVVNAYADFGTDNALDLSGARAHTWARSGIGGWLNLPVADVEFDAAAQVAIVGSYMDGHVDVVGKRLYAYSKSVPEVELEYEKSWSKSACATYNYGIAGVGLNASFCAGGGAGAKFDASIKAKEESGVAPFDDATTIGVAEVGVTPSVNFSMSASAELNLAVAKGGITGELTIVDVSLPTVGNLYWGLIDGPALVVTWGISSTLQVELLHGEVSVYVDLLKPKWCGCGSWCPGYPCAEWAQVVHKTLADFDGWKYGLTLLDKQAKKGLVLK